MSDQEKLQTALLFFALVFLMFQNAKDRRDAYRNIDESLTRVDEAVKKCFK